MARKIALIAAVVVSIAVVGISTAVAAGAGGDDKPLTGSTLEKATTAALEHTRGGTVIETEIGDDGAAYGVEVRLADGTAVEVELDENFVVIGQETDDDGQDEQDGPDDD